MTEKLVLVYLEAKDGRQWVVLTQETTPVKAMGTAKRLVRRGLGRRIDFVSMEAQVIVPVFPQILRIRASARI